MNGCPDCPSLQYALDTALVEVTRLTSQLTTLETQLAEAKKEINDCRDTLRQGYFAGGIDYPGDELALKDLSEHWHTVAWEYWVEKFHKDQREHDAARMKLMEQLAEAKKAFDGNIEATEHGQARWLKRESELQSQLAAAQRGRAEAEKESERARNKTIHIFRLVHDRFYECGQFRDPKLEPMGE